MLSEKQEFPLVVTIGPLNSQIHILLHIVENQKSGMVLFVNSHKHHTASGFRTLVTVCTECSLK
jgi:hypothetical protein